MKRAQSPCLCDSDREERPTKVPRRESLSTPPESLKREQEEQIRTQQPLSPNCDSINPTKLERQAKASPSLTNATTKRTDDVFKWIPPPWEIDELDAIDVMSQPASKRSRSQSISIDRGRVRSVSSEGSEISSARDAKSSAYKATNYVTILETKGRFMRRSSAGPIPEDIAFCERLLQQQTETLQVDLHPLLMPSAENQFI